MPVLLCVGPRHRIRRRPGLVISRERLPASDVAVVDGFPCTKPLRTAFDGARSAADVVEAVVFVDMMATCGLVDLRTLRQYVAAHPGWAGVAQCRRALDLAVYGSRSPPETRLRLVWLRDAGLPRPLVNPKLFDPAGRLLGLPDLLDDEAGVAVEYDGDDHRDIDQHTADNDREELFEEHGLLVTRVTRLHLRGRRAALVERMRRARARGLARDRRHDRWTLSPPADTPT